jgi:hypothetical protein
MKKRKARYRAPLRDKRVVDVHFKLTEGESRSLEALAAKEGMTLSAYIRLTALGVK